VNDDISQENLLRIAGADQLDLIKITPLKESLFDDFSTLETRLQKDLDHLKDYLGDLKLHDKYSHKFHYKLDAGKLVETCGTRNYRRNVGVEYTVITVKSWLFHTRYRATLLLTSGSQQEAITYAIPTPVKKGIPLKEGVLSDVTNVMERFSIALGSDPHVDAFLARGIANLTGVDALAKIFSLRKYQNLQGDLNKKLTVQMRTIQTEVTQLFEAVRENLESVLKADPSEIAHQHLDKQIEEAKQTIKKQADQVSRALQYQAEGFTRRQENKLKELEQVIQKNQEKQDKLDQKLVDHRKKVAKNSHLIGPALESVFPDVEGQYRYRSNATYDHVVDGHLRTLYGLRLREDLNKNPHIEVEQALNLLRILRNECYPLNGRPVGKAVREIYTGLRALFDYITEFEVTADYVTKLLTATAKARKGKKPEIEPFIEKALSHDFHMGKYAKGLHKKGAKTKTDLGLK
jgi:hypothetical protein